VRRAALWPPMTASQTSRNRSAVDFIDADRPRFGGRRDAATTRASMWRPWTIRSRRLPTSMPVVKFARARACVHHRTTTFAVP